MGLAWTGLAESGFEMDQFILNFNCGFFSSAQTSAFLRDSPRRIKGLEQIDSGNQPIDFSLVYIVKCNSLKSHRGIGVESGITRRSAYGTGI